MKTQEKIDQLIADLETQVAQLKKEATETNEAEAIALLRAVDQQHVKLLELVKRFDDLTLSIHCNSDDLDAYVDERIAARTPL